LLLGASCGRFGYDAVAQDELGVAGGGGSDAVAGSGARGGDASGGGVTASAGTASGISATAGATGEAGAGIAAPVREDSYPNFEDSSGLKLVESAQASGGTLVLVPGVESSRGAVYLEQPLVWPRESRLAVAFSARLLPAPPHDAGDGFTFVLHRDPRGLDAIGAGGLSLGYCDAQGIRPSVAVEFDTFPGDDDPVRAEHVGILVDGTCSSVTHAPHLPVALGTGEPFYVWIDYSEESSSFDVFLAASSDKPASPIVTYSVSLFDALGSEWFAGFTASTGAAMSEHLIDRFELRQFSTE
jgi:hypothetical protein